MSKDQSEDMLGVPLEGPEAEFIAERVLKASQKLKDAESEIQKEVWGQDRVINLTLACMVAGGNLLAEGVPGTAKTRLVSRIATVMGLDFNRVQFTPDLMPSDILGSEVMKPDGSFKFEKGPVFTQFLMADEINRAGPRTQAALLEAMQEKKVTAAGETYRLQKPFHVMATQNPLEQEGVYPLPEAQLDRFLMKVNVDYPTEQAERRVMVETTGTGTDLKDMFNRMAAGEDFTLAADKDEEMKVQAVLGKNDLIFMQKLAARLPLSKKVVDAAMHIVRNARPDNPNAPKEIQEHVEYGPGPRAVQAFAQVAKARALMDGRLAPGVEDVLAVTDEVLQHRMGIGFAARAEGVEYRDIRHILTKGLK